MNVVFIGFDSAWADNPSYPGAICAVTHNGERFLDFIEPRLVQFSGAQEFVAHFRSQEGLMIIAIDQPTIVPNQRGMRLVERVAASAISWLGGGVQPAYRGRQEMFGDDAPIWRFIASSKAQQHPNRSRSAISGRFLMEVYPALALPSFNPSFCGRGKIPRYNPANKRKFRREDWTAVINTVRTEATKIECAGLVTWCNRLIEIDRPEKADQDMLDAAVCLLVAVQWKLGDPSASAMIGDLQRGYIVSPLSDVIRDRIEEKACQLGVKIGGIVPDEPRPGEFR